MRKSESLIGFVLGLTAATAYDANWTSLDTRPLPSWYDDAKVGIFIVGGVFSVPSWGEEFGGASGEWFQDYWQLEKRQSYVDFMAQNYPPGFTYADFAASLKYDLFNATQWAELFVKSGAKYTVFLTKHHDGFTLWPSATSFNWNSQDVGPRRDVTGEITAATKAAGLHAGVYHSLFEWVNPLFLADQANNFTTRNFVKKTMGELHDLVSRYEPDVIWSDGDWPAGDEYWQAPLEFLQWLVNDSPVKDTVVFNDRWGKGDSCKHGSFYSCQDRYNPGKVQTHKWENAMTLDYHSWGYRRNARAGDYMPLDQLLEQLVSTVAFGGNILINVGPAVDGSIPVIMEERLVSLGAWLSVNGEGVYGQAASLLHGFQSQCVCVPAPLGLADSGWCLESHATQATGRNGCLLINCFRRAALWH
jgi:alpha-L-fucosidase